MSKVVHLSEEAHAKAKVHCKSRGVRMSDWVAELIEKALVAPAAVTPERTLLNQRKQLPRLETAPKTDSEGVAVYAAPPFWEARAR